MTSKNKNALPGMSGSGGDAERSLAKWTSCNEETRVLRTRTFCKACNDSGGEIGKIVALVENGVDINRAYGIEDARGDVWTDSPLGWAIDAKWLELVVYLIDLGVEVDVLAEHGSTPLHLAAQMGQLKIAEALVEAGASTTKRATNGWTAAEWATRSAHPDYDGDPNKRNQVEKFLGAP